MFALTIQQPYAWAIMEGIKTVENRTWRPWYEGPLLIHAGKGKEWMCDVLEDGTAVSREELVFGAILGVVDLVMPVPAYYTAVEDNPFAQGPYCWILEHPRKFETPIPWRGAQRIWIADEKRQRDDKERKLSSELCRLSVIP